MRATQFRAPTNFNTEDPMQLSRQLNQLAGAAQQALVAVDDGHLQSLVATRRYSAAPPKPVTVGQAVLIDTAAGSVTVTLERPSRELANQLLAVVKRSSLNTLTLQVAPPAPGGTQGKINAAATFAYVAGKVGLFLVLCDGTDWWSTP